MGHSRRERRERTERLISLRSYRLLRVGLPVEEPHRFADVRRFCLRGCVYCRRRGALRSILRAERQLLVADDDLALVTAHVAAQLSVYRGRLKYRRI